MTVRIKIKLYSCAVISLATTLLIFYDELVRRLSDHFLIYCVIWGISIFAILFIGLKLFGLLNNFKLIALTALVAYLSGILAYLLAVVNVNLVNSSYSIEFFLISLVFPFFALKGWVFCLLFVSTSLFSSIFIKQQNVGMSNN